MERPGNALVKAAYPPMPDAATRLRNGRTRLAGEALIAAVRRDPTLEERYDALQFRTFLRDMDRHILRLALALEQGDVGPVTDYVGMLVPLYRRRRVPLEDFGTMLLGALDAARADLPGDEADAASLIIEAGLAQLERPRHLPGDKRRSPILSLLWKGAGILD